MKTKRIVFSMVVFLTVYWLSVIFDVEKPFTSDQGHIPDADEAITIAANDVVEEAASEPITYSIDGMETASYDEKLYLSQRTIESQLAGSTEENVISGFAAEASVQDNTVDAAKDEVPPVTDAEQTKEEEPTEKESLYSNIGISDAESYVNIRKDANTDSEVLGKLYRGSAAEILDTVGDWYYVESGSVKGYLKSDFLKTGIPDDELIEKYGILRISVKVDGLNVREKPDTESDKLTCVYLNETYPVIELQEEWIKVDIKDDRVIGYVKREFAELIVNFKKAVSKEEEQELLRLQEEERIKLETAVKYRDEVDYTKDELKLLACLVHAEAGNQSYEGKLAVANIVLNRVKSSKYPDTIKAVIYQPGQFSVASSGSLKKQLANYDDYSSNSQILSIKAARAALEGANNIGNRLYFHSFKSAVRKGYDDKKTAVKLEDQLFW